MANIFLCYSKIQFWIGSILPFFLCTFQTKEIILLDPVQNMESLVLHTLLWSLAQPVYLLSSFSEVNNFLMVLPELRKNFSIFNCTSEIWKILELLIHYSNKRIILVVQIILRITMTSPNYISSLSLGNGMNVLIPPPSQLCVWYYHCCSVRWL